MTLITWNDTLSVGVNEIDLQHQKLVQLINGLHEHMLKGGAHDIMQKVLDRVIQYTVMHFQTEAALMARHGYPHTPRLRSSARWRMAVRSVSSRRATFLACSAMRALRSSRVSWRSRKSQ